MRIHVSEIIKFVDQLRNNIGTKLLDEIVSYGISGKLVTSLTGFSWK